MVDLLSNRAEQILRDADRVCRFGTGLHSALRVVLLFQVIGVFAVPVLAQTEVSTRDPDSFVNQQRILAERVRDSLDRELTFGQKVFFDFGGW